MFITYKEVHEDIKRAPEGTTIGVCGNPSYCLIANVIWHKYPDLQEVSVSVPAGGDSIAIQVHTHTGAEKVTTGSDGHKLFELARAFDELGQYGHQVDRETALGLFQ